jgi:hypothetical protein
VKKLFFIAASVFLLLAFCEGMARIAYRLTMQRPYAASELTQRINTILEKQSSAAANERGSSGRAHPYYGFVARDDRPLPSRRGFKDVTASQLGFTGDTPLFDPSGKTFLAVVTGGSVAHYFAMDKGKALLDWLAARPEFAGRTGRLLDVALPGYKQPQQLFILSDLLSLGVRPDVILNLDGFNEACIARKNLEASGYPFMPWFWGDDNAPSRERLRQIGRIEFMESLRAQAAGLLAHLPALPAIIGFPAAALDKMTDARIGKLEAAMVRDRATTDALARQRTNQGGSAYLGPNVVITPGQFADLAAEEWSRASILMHDMARSVGGRYFHALQPAEPLWAEARGENPQPLCPETCVDSGYPTFVRYGDALAAAGLRFAYLGPAMVGTAGVFKDCCHVTPAGQDALFAAVTAFLDQTWDAATTSVDPDTTLAALTSRPPAPFDGADLLSSPAPDSVVTANLREVERSNEGPYRTALGGEIVVSLPLASARALTVAFGLKNPLPGQTVTVRFNGQDLGTFPLDKADARLDKTLEAQGAAGLNTLTFFFGKTNVGPLRNKDIPEGYAAQFTALTLRPAP